jgi:predicted NBD/HSP70 family sugar kinase
MYDELLTRVEDGSNVSRKVISRIFTRVMISSPQTVARADIVQGTMLVKPSTLNQSAVSKAVKCLIDEGLLTEYDEQPDGTRSGRPVKPLALGGQKWALMGIKVIRQDDRPVKLYGVVTDMRIDPNLELLAQLELKLPEHVTFLNVADHIRELHDDLLQRLETPRELFGVGIEVAWHVREGVVVGPSHMGLPPTDEYDLLTPLQEQLGVPVVIDNDVNVLAVRESYRPKAERHAAVVAVLEEGVGGSLIIDGRVYRGGGGMAAEPGHHVVVNLPKLPPANGVSPGFDAPCPCGKSAHVDCFAPPSRLRAQLENALHDAGRHPAREAGELTAAGRIFRIGGEALGQAIASIVNVTSPSSVLLILPGDLAPDVITTRNVSKFTKDGNEKIGRAKPRSAAAEYLDGVESALDEYSFSTGAVDARAGQRYLTVQVMDADQAERQGAICAAIRVLDAFVMHAREQDRCHELTEDGSTYLAK